jgi:acetyl-CoA carboxylase carboxyltransferase component
VPPGSVAVSAPLHGVVVETPVRPGEPVRAGSPLLVVEAMKMEHVVPAPCTGVVSEMAVRAGDEVTKGVVVAVLEDTGEEHTDEESTAEVDLDRIRPDLAESRDRHRVGLDEGRPDAVDARRRAGRRTARESVAELCDSGSFVEYGALTVAAQRRRRSLAELIERTPADGLVAGIGTVEGARCVVLAYDYTVLAGTQGLQNHNKLDRMLRLARRHDLPVVIFAEGGGGRPGDTDTAAVSSLDVPTFRLMAGLSGTVPLVGVVSGYCFAGNAVLAGCCDVIIATEDANLGMGGPAMIEGGGLGSVAADDIGPMSVQEPNGVVDLVVSDDAAAARAARGYLAYFTGSRDPGECADQRIMRHLVPEDRVRGYDILPVIHTLADVDSVLELRPSFGTGIVTALARIEGRPVGVLANNPRHLGGAIDSAAADKASRFLQLCNTFGLPVVSLCDTPGFMVGVDSERTATVRHFSRMFVVGANLDVPLCTVVLRKGYGLGAMAMSAGGLKASTVTVAWPTGEFGGMNLEGAVRLAYRKELGEIEEGEAREARYAELVAEMYERGKALSTAAVFEVDDVIDPADTRAVIAQTLEAAGSVPSSRPRRTWIDPW